jgi:PAS domain S-box-containing protein
LRLVWMRYLLAVVSSALVVGIKTGLDRLIGTESPFLLLFSAVFLSAMYGGPGPGIVAALLTGAAGDYFFLQPTDGSASSPVLLVRLGVYTLECAAVIAMCAAHHRSRADNERLRMDLEDQVAEFQAIVTTQATTERALRYSETRFRALFENSRDGIGVAAQGKILYVNPAYASMLGYASAEEVVGLSVLDVVAPEDRQQLAERRQRRAQGEAEPDLYDFRGLRKDGALVDIENHVSTYTLDGEMYTLVIARDVTARMRAETALRAQEERQRFLAQAGEALASSLDYQTTLTSVARLAVPYMADWCFVDIVTEDGKLERVAASHSDPIKRAFQLELQERYPTRLDDPVGPASVLRTGKSEWVSHIPEELIRASAYDDEHFRLLTGLGLTSLLCVPMLARDRTVGVITLISAESGRAYTEAEVALAEDLAHRAALAVDNARLYRAAQVEIATREEVQQALRQHQSEIEALNQRLRRAMIETHHRVKNNLQVISAMIDLQTMEETETLPSSEFARLSQHVRMLATVHDLLTEQAKRDNEANTLSARQLLEKFVPLVEQMAFQQTLSVEIEDAVLTSDQGTSLALIANEIYSNAIKHGNSEVHIHFYVQDDKAVLEVSDDGPGFPPDFDPQYAANTGLELVLNLTSLDLRGTIHFDNRPEGGGRVRVSFPLHTEARLTPTV